MFYLQYSYEQISIINKLVREIKTLTGHDIKLSDEEHMEKLDAVMPEIEDETINKLYKHLKDSLHVEQKKFISKKAETDADDKQMMYRGSKVESKAETADKTTEISENSEEKKRKKRVYRGQVIEE